VRRTIRFSIILIVACISCERVEYYPDKPIIDHTTYVLAHQGGGFFDAGNTMEACVHGLSILDGIEVDIQKSLDNNIWLSHSTNILPCGSFPDLCFASLPSSSIIEIDSCLGNTINYTQLETVFEFMSTHHPQKFISLDVKAWGPCGVSLNVTKDMNALAQRIIELTAKYHMENKVMVESQTGDFLYYMKKHCTFIETYLTTFGDLELGISRALDAGYSGVSFQYNVKEAVVKEQIDLMHRKGLKIQLWTLEEASQLEEAIALNPDFVQTDSF
jgi:glycerophosphoryl diester phosphodiesterase